MSFGLKAKCPLFLLYVNEFGIFSTDFRKNTEISNLIKIRPVRAECYAGELTDGRDETLSLSAILQTALKMDPTLWFGSAWTGLIWLRTEKDVS
jgi:hypothetical protein